MLTLCLETRTVTNTVRLALWSLESVLLWASNKHGTTVVSVHMLSAITATTMMLHTYSVTFKQFLWVKIESIMILKHKTCTLIQTSYIFKNVRVIFRSNRNGLSFCPLLGQHVLANNSFVYQPQTLCSPTYIYVCVSVCVIVLF